jgi:uncharacterized membrane protein
MNMQDSGSRPLITLIGLITFALVYIVYTTAGLPDTVATHFGIHNQANGWMSRNGYLLFTVALLLGMPTFINFCVGILPAKIPRWTNIPNRNYWLAPERLEASVRFLAAHGKWLGCLMVAMITAMHYIILTANRTEPATLPMTMFLLLIVGFLFSVFIWVAVLYRRFMKRD